MTCSCKLCSGSGRYRGVTGKENFCACRAGQNAETETLFSQERIAQLCRPEQIAWLIRKNLEAYAKRNGYSKTLEHLCGLASMALLIALKREGYSASVATGMVAFTDHAWVIHSRKILDLTYTQFDPKAPRVLVLKTRPKLYHQTRLYRKPQPIFTSFTPKQWERNVSKIIEGVNR